MGFLAPAVPWIIKGGASLLGGLLGRKSQQSAMKRSPEELAALTGAQSAAGTLTQQGSQLIGVGLPALQKSLGYYQTLLGGNRAAMSQATTGARESITDTYRGAEHGLERSGVQGATGDLARAELSRDRAAKIAGLTSGVQPGAAAALMQGGQGAVNAGTYAGSNAASIWGNLLGQGQRNREYGREEGAKAGQGIGSFLFDILSGTIGKKFGMPRRNAFSGAGSDRSSG